MLRRGWDNTDGGAGSSKRRLGDFNNLDDRAVVSGGLVVVRLVVVVVVVAVVVAGFTDWRNCLKSASTSALLVVCRMGGNVVVFKFKSSNS